MNPNRRKKEKQTYLRIPICPALQRKQKNKVVLLTLFLSTTRNFQTNQELSGWEGARPRDVHWLGRPAGSVE